MFLVIGSSNTTYRPLALEEKRGWRDRLLGRKQQPLLEAK